ncbi:MAG: insulinase family protein [Deltaproteobacteria bacterium]|nr:insulinase family protein [Deltaproteobacteria bacterium]
MRSVALLIPLLLLPLLLLPLACPAAASEAAAQIEDPALRLQREVLDNGLEVLLLEDHGTPVVSVQLWVRAGSRDEGFYTGIAHLFEHMMFKGSKHLGPEEHAQLIGARGGRINAFTSRDVTVYHADVTAESLPLVIDLEAERLAHLDISEETLTSERQVVLEERRLRVEDRPGGLAFEALAASLWVAHPYRWPVIGWRSDVESVTVEACREFFDTYYSANNIALVVVGDFETKPTLAHITRAFGSLRSADAVPRRPTVEPPQRGERRATVHYEIQAPLLYAAWHAPATGHADGAALDVASLILSAGRSSRLYRALVYEDQVALYAHGGYMELSDAGMFYAVAGARPGVEISRVEEGFFAEIRKIAQEGRPRDGPCPGESGGLRHGGLRARASPRRASGRDPAGERRRRAAGGEPVPRRRSAQRDSCNRAAGILVTGGGVAVTCSPRPSAAAGLLSHPMGLALTLVLALAPACARDGGGAAKPAWELPPPPARETPVVQPGALTRLRLENGMHLLILEDHSLPRVVMGVKVRRGAGSVGLEQAGLASYTSELMKRGAGARDALQLALAVDEIGASLSVNAGWDAMGVGVAGLSRDLDRLVDVLADVTLRPRFDVGEAERARGEHLAALTKALDDPATLLRWQMARSLYGGHRYGLPIDGTQATVAALDAAAAQALYARYFVPNNAILYVAGDVDRDDWVARAEAAFGSWSPGELPPASPPPPNPTPSERRVVVVDRPDLVQARIGISHEGIRRTDPERIQADLMNKILGGSGFSSRLMVRVRSDAGLTYSIGSGFSLRREPGPFTVSTFTRVPEAREAVDLILQIVEEMHGAQPPTRDELDRAKSYAVGSFGLGLETSAAVMAGLVSLDIHGLPEDSLDTYRSRVRAVTLEQAAGIAGKLLHPERAAIVVAGPADALVPALEGLGPVEVVEIEAFAE